MYIINDAARVRCAVATERLFNLPSRVGYHACFGDMYIYSMNYSQSKHFYNNINAAAGPTVWNSLPDYLRHPALGPELFLRDLKTHLFSLRAS